jgi:hypothetical protein
MAGTPEAHLEGSDVFYIIIVYLKCGCYVGITS